MSRKEFPIRTAQVVRAANPDLPEYWNVADLVVQAGLYGLPMGHAFLSEMIAKGKGPAVCGTVGSSSVLVTPEEGRRWIKEKLERRRKLQPTVVQRKFGIDDDNFASL